MTLWPSTILQLCVVDPVFSISNPTVEFACEVTFTRLVPDALKSSKVWSGLSVPIPTLPADVMRSDSPPAVLVPIISGIPALPLLFAIVYELPSNVWS